VKERTRKLTWEQQYARDWRNKAPPEAEPEACDYSEGLSPQRQRLRVNGQVHRNALRQSHEQFGEARADW